MKNFRARSTSRLPTARKRDQAACLVHPGPSSETRMCHLCSMFASILSNSPFSHGGVLSLAFGCWEASCGCTALSCEPDFMAFTPKYKLREANAAEIENGVCLNLRRVTRWRRSERGTRQGVRRRWWRRRWSRSLASLRRCCCVDWRVGRQRCQSCCW